MSPSIGKITKSSFRATRSRIGKILRPKPTFRKGVLAILIVLAIIATANQARVVRLSQYEVEDRSLASLESAIGLDHGLDEIYSDDLKLFLEEKREPITESLKEHISNEQTRRSNLILGVLIGLSFSGLLIVLAPVTHARRYPKRKSILIRFSWLAAIMFVVVGNIFVGIYAITRFAQSIVSTASNPQLSLTESTFDFLIANSGELASVGPGIIEPTLRALEDDPGAPALETILNNVYIFMGEIEVYRTVIDIVKFTSGIFSLIPLLVLLVAFALVLRNALPTMRRITRLPGDAARGEVRAGRTAIGETTRAIGREIVYALALIGVLLVVTFVIASIGSNSIEPTLRVILNYLIASIVYLQLSEEAQPGLVFFSVATTLTYLVLGMTLTVGVAGLFLFKASSLLRHSTRSGFRSIQQRRFWLVGFLGLVWMMLFPLIYAQISANIVTGLIQVGVNYNAWGFIFITPPIVLLGLFFIALWAANGYRTIRFIWKFAPEEVVREESLLLDPENSLEAELSSSLDDVTVRGDRSPGDN